VLVYHSRESLAHAVGVYGALSQSTPCLFVRTKSDAEAAGPVDTLGAETFCEREGISAPECVSLRDGLSLDFYSSLWRLASLPSAGNPFFKRELDVMLGSEKAAAAGASESSSSSSATNPASLSFFSGQGAAGGATKAAAAVAFTAMVAGAAFWIMRQQARR
jgi:hypothetical protein